MRVRAQLSAWSNRGGSQFGRKIHGHNLPEDRGFDPQGSRQLDWLNCHHVKGPKRVEEEDQAQDEHNDIERRAFDEHTDNVVDDVEDESGD